MKKQLVNTLGNTARKSIVRFICTSLFIVTSFTVPAQSDTTSPELPLNIRYIGSIDNQPVFQVDIDSTSGETYILSIQDQSGGILYSEKVKGKPFSKKFRWDNTDLYVTKLVITLSGKEGRSSRVFEVNASTRMVQDVVITKL